MMVHGPALARTSRDEGATRGAWPGPSEESPMEPPTDPDGSVTRWLGDLKAGDQDAARRLWDRYFEQLVRLARSKRRGLPDPGVHSDEEDVALSALDCVFRGAAEGKYPDLGDRDDL